MLPKCKPSDSGAEWPKEWEHASSSHVLRFAWVKERNELWVEFVDYTVYVYSHVEARHVSALRRAKSFGRQFADVIRKNPELFPYRKVQ